MKIKVGLIQMEVSDSKEKNIQKAENMISKAAYQGAKLIVLPEMFNCPYDNICFTVFAEEQGGYTWKKLSYMASENNILLVGGSIPEIDKDKKIYNTCFVFDENGRQIAKHRKIHLFDINVDGGQYFKESDTLTAGDSLTVFDTEFGKMGAAICYDVRFPELFRLMALGGAQIIIVPGAFNMTTGPAHWELLFRSRALDNQVYMIGDAPARNTNSCYISYGNSLIADPWGNITGKLDQNENILISEIDTDVINNVRLELPVLKNRRSDVYKKEYTDLIY